MTDHDRGAYSPQTDAPLAFDARRSTGGGGFPTTLVISLGILALLIVAIVLFYRSGVRGAGQGPAPVGAPVAQIKTPAPASGQPSDEATGLQIYKTETLPTAPPPPPTFAPPPEQPVARPTQPVTAQALPAANAVAATGATQPAKAVPVQAAPAPARKDQIAELLDKSAGAPATAKPVAKPVTATAATPVAKPVATAAGAASVQIGAYSSQALAAKGWSDLDKAFASDMAGKGQHFEPVTVGGKTLYRAAVTGFESKASAQAFCAKLKAANHPCIVK